MMSIMTSCDVRNEKLTIFTWNNPRYQILSLKNITKGGIVDVCRSIISNFIDILRKMTKNDVINDVKTVFYKKSNQLFVIQIWFTTR